jgi:hypothetical protein
MTILLLIVVFLLAFILIVLTRLSVQVEKLMEILADIESKDDPPQ